MTTGSFISNWYRRRVRSRARALLRTHHAILRAAHDLESHRLVGFLEDAGSPVPDDALGGLLHETYRGAGKICLRQHCLTMNFSFLLAEAGKHLFAPGSPLTMPVPKRWRAHLRQQGLVLSTQSLLRFIIVIFDRLTAGLRAGRLLILAQPRGWQIVPPAVGYHAFIDVGPGNLPDPFEREERCNLYSWYRAYYKLEKDFSFVAENRGIDAPQWYGTKSVMAPRQFPPLDPASRRKFIRAAICLMVQAVLWTLLGRWWYAILLTDVVELAYFRMIPDKLLAQRYIFHAGNCLVRPLWTYDAEARGSAIVNVFYSANFITFTPNPDILPARTFALSAMSWPELICTDSESKNALIQYGMAPSAVTVSQIPIDFYDSGSPLPVISGLVVVVFEVTPYRSYFKASRGFHNAYYTFDTWVHFVDDIVESAKKNGWTVVLKTKRHKDRFNATAYQRHIERLEADPNVVIMEAGISASRAMKIANAVVSMPFTSPALIAAGQNCPSVFYDPGGKLSSYKSLARGLPMLTNHLELDAWFQLLGTKPVSTKQCSSATIDV